VSDNEDVSTPELIRQIAEALGKPARLFYLLNWNLPFTLAQGLKQTAEWFNKIHWHLYSMAL